LTGLELQTPGWAVVAVLVALPLVALAVGLRRRDRVLHALALDRPARRAAVVPAVALAGIALLVGTAAAQPVVVDDAERPVRRDAEALFVLDVSRSMLAAPAPGAPSRFDRARGLALRLRAAIPAVPAGVASLTDRALPHLFPSADARAFTSTLDRAVRVGRPLPLVGGGRATSFAPLAAVAGRGYFGEDVERRVAVVLTDGESTPFDVAGLRAELAEAPPLEILFVRLSAAGERVFRRGGSAEGYRTDRRAGEELSRLAAALGAEVVSEAEPARAESLLQGALGRGPTRAVRERRSTTALAPFVLAAALAPLGLLVVARNRA
jgi:hypothetical protein